MKWWITSVLLLCLSLQICQSIVCKITARIQAPNDVAVGRKSVVTPVRPKPISKPTTAYCQFMFSVNDERNEVDLKKTRAKCKIRKGSIRVKDYEVKPINKLPSIHNKMVLSTDACADLIFKIDLFADRKETKLTKATVVVFMDFSKLPCPHSGYDITGPTCGPDCDVGGVDPDSCPCNNRCFQGIASWEDCGELSN